MRFFFALLLATSFIAPTVKASDETVLKLGPKKHKKKVYLC